MALLSLGLHTNLGDRPPDLHLDHGVRIPIAPEIVQPLAYGHVDADYCHEQAEKLPRPAIRKYKGVTAHAWASVLRVTNPSEFLIVATEFMLTWWSRTDAIVKETRFVDRVTTALEAAQICYWSIGPEYFDAAFKEQVPRLIEADRQIQVGRFAASNAGVLSFDDRQLAVGFAGAKVEFLTKHRAPYELLRAMGDGFPRGEKPAATAALEIGADPADVDGWARTACSRIRQYLRRLGLPFDLAATRRDGDVFIAWRPLPSDG
jgi:hypothetical protein